MQSQGASASRAAYTVGYESVPQFTREYGRMFERPPAADALAALYGGREEKLADQGPTTS